MPIHNKLVRDKMPKVIGKTGKVCHIHTLTSDEYLAELDRKLNEECAEYQTDKSLEELADMLSLIDRTSSSLSEISYSPFLIYLPISKGSKSLTLS